MLIWSSNDFICFEYAFLAMPIYKKTHPERAVLVGSGVSMLLQRYDFSFNHQNLPIVFSCRIRFVRRIQSFSPYLNKKSAFSKASYHIGSPISFLFTNYAIDFHELAPNLPSLVRSIFELMQVNAN